jgi:hypothetical protein
VTPDPIDAPEMRSVPALTPTGFVEVPVHE